MNRELDQWLDRLADPLVILADKKLTCSQALVLVQVAKHPGISGRELETATGFDASNVSQILQVLGEGRTGAGKNLIQSFEIGRSKNWRLTGEGHETVIRLVLCVNGRKAFDLEQPTEYELRNRRVTPNEIRAKEQQARREQMLKPKE